MGAVARASGTYAAGPDKRFGSDDAWVDQDGADQDGADQDGADEDSVDDAWTDLGWTDGDGAAEGRGADEFDSAPPAVRRRGSRRLDRLKQDWVPEPWQNARVDPGRRGTVVLAVIAAVAAVVAALGTWWFRPESRPAQATSEQSAAPTSGSVQRAAGAGSGVAAGRTDANLATGDPAPGGGRGETHNGAGNAPGGSSRAAAKPTRASASPIWVSVTGLVRKPGLVRLRAGARVADAIAAAGGVSEQGSVTGLNLAVVLSDGDSVVVGAAPTVPPSGTVATGPDAGASRSPPSSSAGGVVNLNTADQAALEALPGVGPVMAANILAWREKNGPFTSSAQLQEVPGIGPARLRQLEPLVTV